MGDSKAEEGWVFCPICGNKTRIKVRGDTVLEHSRYFVRNASRLH